LSAAQPSKRSQKSICRESLKATVQAIYRVGQKKN